MNVPSKSNKQKNLKNKISFLLASWRLMTKIAGSGSISQRQESADLDPHQNVMDPQHCSSAKEPDLNHAVDNWPNPISAIETSSFVYQVVIAPMFFQKPNILTFWQKPAVFGWLIFFMLFPNRHMILLQIRIQFSKSHLSQFQFHSRLLKSRSSFKFTSLRQCIFVFLAPFLCPSWLFGWDMV